MGRGRPLETAQRGAGFEDLVELPRADYRRKLSASPDARGRALGVGDGVTRAWVQGVVRGGRASLRGGVGPLGLRAGGGACAPEWGGVLRGGADKVAAAPGTPEGRCPRQARPARRGSGGR